ncbi:hypothetical protein AKJ51_00155 [candidate division MSBL1 archaeon SCGC-AAA382A20]|uniref:HTH arsR-type domain-containing protein n=1 Tax=candidate division MSBL1 archaeon SCGC-AAA382A20 TaxID=1698280 RepID=A0A133VMV0_9EURY|nr:hypothetical protein AKJ51_00155 [candidate division MSBL1 archaeon SCGC-AAA382A20]
MTRIPVVLRDENQLERWNEAAEDFTDNDRSRLVRRAVEEKIDEWRSDSDMESEIGSQIEPVRNSVDGLHERVRMMNEKFDLLKLQLEEERNGTELQAAREILDHLVEEDMTISEISNKLDYDSNIIDASLALLEGLGLIELNRRDLEG